MDSSATMQHGVGAFPGMLAHASAAPLPMPVLNFLAWGGAYPKTTHDSFHANTKLLGMVRAYPDESRATMLHGASPFQY